MGGTMNILVLGKSTVGSFVGSDRELKSCDSKDGHFSLLLISGLYYVHKDSGRGSFGVYKDIKQARAAYRWKSGGRKSLPKEFREIVNGETNGQ